MPTPSLSATGVAILSKAGCSDAAAKTVITLFMGPPPDGPPMQAETTHRTGRSQTFLRTGQLHAHIGGLDHRYGRHPWLEGELGGGPARVTPRLWGGVSDRPAVGQKHPDGVDPPESRPGPPLDP